jgi:hypothetical protein
VIGRITSMKVCVDLIRYGINSFQNFVSNGKNAARFLNMCCQLEEKKKNFRRTVLHKTEKKNNIQK